MPRLSGFVRTRYQGLNGQYHLVKSEGVTSPLIYILSAGGSSRWARGGDDKNALSYPGGRGRYGGGGGLLTLAMNGCTRASSISLSRLYLCIRVAIRSREGVCLQLHQHLPTLNMSTSPARVPNMIPAIVEACVCCCGCNWRSGEEDVGDGGRVIHVWRVVTLDE